MINNNNNHNLINSELGFCKGNDFRDFEMDRKLIDRNLVVSFTLLSIYYGLPSVITQNGLDT